MALPRNLASPLQEGFDISVLSTDPPSLRLDIPLIPLEDNDCINEKNTPGRDGVTRIWRDVTLIMSLAWASIDRSDIYDLEPRYFYGKKRPGLIVLNRYFAGVTNYVIRNHSKYSNITITTSFSSSAKTRTGPNPYNSCSLQTQLRRNLPLLYDLDRSPSSLSFPAVLDVLSMIHHFIFSHHIILVNSWLCKT